jgi:hypothetical protein
LLLFPKKSLECCTEINRDKGGNMILGEEGAKKGRDGKNSQGSQL